MNMNPGYSLRDLTCCWYVATAGRRARKRWKKNHCLCVGRQGNVFMTRREAIISDWEIYVHTEVNKITFVVYLILYCFD